MIKTTMIHPWHLTTLKGHNFWWFPKPFRVLTILFCCVNDEIHLHKSTRILEERPDIVCLRSDQLRFSRRWNFKALSLLSLHGMEVELKSTKVDEYVVQKKTHQGDVTCDNLGKLLRHWYSSSCDIDILLAALLCNWNFSYQNVLSPRKSESLCSTICAVFFLFFRALLVLSSTLLYHRFLDKPRLPSSNIGMLWEVLLGGWAPQDLDTWLGWNPHL